VAKTYEPIASTTLGSDTAEVTFSSIASSWTDLVVIGLLDFTSSGPGLWVRFNGDTGSNYSYTMLTGNGSSAASGRDSSVTQALVGFPIWGGSTAQDNLTIFQVMSYANTNVYKTVLHSSALASQGVHRGVSLWRNTSAISSLTLRINFGSIATGSVISLFGVKAA